MTSGGKSLQRQQPKEDDLQRPHSVRNLVIGTGVLGAITIICWVGTGASQSGTSANGFIACSAANCPAPTALPMESPAAAQANGSSGGNPKAIGGSTKRSGSITGLPPIISALLNPPTKTTGTTVGPVAHPSSSAPGTTPTTPAAGKTSSAATPTKSATPTATATTPAPTPDTTPTTVPPTTVPPTTVPPTTVPPTTVPPTTVAPSATVLPTVTITASLTVGPTSPGPTTS